VSANCVHGFERFIVQNVALLSSERWKTAVG
jgi:hypothetical protein